MTGIFLSRVPEVTKKRAKFGKHDLGGDGEDALATDPGVDVHLGVDGRSVALSVITWNTDKTFHFDKIFRLHLSAKVCTPRGLNQDNKDL